MKALKLFFVFMIVLNIGVAFAEQVDSNCGQIDDSVDRTTEESIDRPASESSATSAASA